MSMCHIFEEVRCPHYRIGLIGKVIIYDFWDNRDYLSGIVVIIRYIRLGCQVAIYQDVRDLPL